MNVCASYTTVTSTDTPNWNKRIVFVCFSQSMSLGNSRNISHNTDVSSKLARARNRSAIFTRLWGCAMSEIDAQFDLNAHRVRHSQAPWVWDVRRRVWDTVNTFRFVRVSCFLLVVIVVSVIFYCIENFSGTTGSTALMNGTSIVMTNNATIQNGQKLPYIDALFMSASMLSSTGLETVDFSLWVSAI
jgi:hypothetical protein